MNMQTEFTRRGRGGGLSLEKFEENPLLCRGRVPTTTTTKSWNFPRAGEGVVMCYQILPPTHIQWAKSWSYVDFNMAANENALTQSKF